MHKNTKNQLSKAINTLGFSLSEFAETIGYSKDYINAISNGCVNFPSRFNNRHKVAAKCLEAEVCKRKHEQEEALRLIESLLFGMVDADAPTD